MNSSAIREELVFQAIRSSGPGGQNVNKVSSKVELRFNVQSSLALSEEEKILLLQKLKNKISKMGELILVEQTDRSQLINKQKVIAKLFSLLEKALVKPKKRISTKPSRSSIERRLESKRVQSNLKSLRKDPGE
ncbi:MAG: alternative ribosome rescue aminoacyl-tRNA hydrolase ArfB [Bacteroidia bacterium]|jgi:ribosome-associated protein|nr:alternative ribosome rescue aminoacyl-tRNA hydrolase ArfB [Bacteroidia bacterium]